MRKISCTLHTDGGLFFAGVRDGGGACVEFSFATNCKIRPDVASSCRRVYCLHKTALQTNNYSLEAMENQFLIKMCDSLESEGLNIFSRSVTD